MIVVKMNSGIGNQLFIYSFCKYLESKTNSVVYLDISSFETDFSGRKFELDIIDNSIKLFEKEIKWLPWNKKFLIKKIHLVLFKLFSGFIIIDEIKFHVFSQIYDPCKNYYFLGYWQTEKFVKEIDYKVLFEPKLESPSIISFYKKKILNVNNSVAIHIRRGDYFSEKYKNKYGICGAKYFEKALELFPENTNYTLFVFSDDLTWVSENINFPHYFNVVFIEKSDVNSYWYIYLMSLCQNIIISNSTFGWWGAYLGPQTNVICPNMWENNLKSELCPSIWKREKV